MAKARDKRGPLDLDLPERRIVLNENGQVDRIFVPERREANRLIEELMVAANVCAAQTLEQKKAPLIYRVHDQPGPEKLQALQEFLKSLELSFSTSASIKPSHFNQILHKSKSSDKSIQVSEMVLRSQAQAEYNPENYGHFGLNLGQYAHFTSPIRRYADLIVHRALISALGMGKDGLASTEPEKMLSIAQHISMTERRAMAAERQTTDRLIAHFLSGQIGAKFPGKISGVTRSGLFVKLDETGADGFIPAATLGRDYFRYVEEQQAMIGERSGERFRLGDRVEVKLVEAAPMAGALRFELLSKGEQVEPLTRTGHRGARTPKKQFTRGKRRRR
jgi:ribonuclease R